MPASKEQHYFIRRIARAREQILDAMTVLDDHEGLYTATSFACSAALDALKAAEAAEAADDD